MPTYVYKNLETGETFEVRQSIMEDALKEDPKTGAPVHRVIQPVGIAFKGSGFYVNDSKNTKSTTKPPASSADSASDSSAGSSAKADTAKSDSSADKPAATKTETKVASPAATSTKSESSKKPANSNSK